MKKKGNKFRRNFVLFLIAAIMVGSLSACGSKDSWRSKEVTIIDDNYRTWYEIFVYSF